MKQFLNSILSLFFFVGAFAQNYPVDSVRITGENNKRVVYVFLGDGYQESELVEFDMDVEKVINDFFNKTPFREYRNFFNIYRIDVHSNESGSDHPGTATDVTEPAHEVKMVDTEFSTTFDGGGVHRLLVSRDVGNAYAILAQNTPEYDQGFILCNSPHYGGAGGNLATSSTHSAASEIVIHEIGHSFAGLWDEYWNGSGGEFPNMTQESDPDKVKWKHWLGIEQVGIYPYGNTSPQGDWFRPHQNCEMRSLNSEFCPVCTEQIIKSIYNLSPPLESTSPIKQQVVHLGQDIEFIASIIYPIPNTLDINWELNGVIIEKDIDTIYIKKEQLVNDLNILRLLVHDNTNMILDPNAKVDFRKDWTLFKDIDNDGFTSDIDCDDENDLINPEADDIPNNGIDEDCDGDDATTLVLEVNQNLVNIFPNPSNGNINIKSNHDLNTILSIQSMEGKEIFRRTVKFKKDEIYRCSLNAKLTSGIYRLNLYDLTQQNLSSGLISITK